MRQINIKMTDSKDLIASITTLGDKYDNNVTQINFQISSLYDTISNRACVLLFPDLHTKKTVPLTNNSFVITTDISKNSGTFQLVLVGTSATYTSINDIINPPDNVSVFVSKQIQINIRDNLVDDTVTTETLDTNLKTIYDNLVNAVEYVDSDAFKIEIFNDVKAYVDTQLPTYITDQLKTDIKNAVLSDVQPQLNQIETNKTDISTLKTEVNTNTTDISTLKTNVSTLQTNVQTNTTNIQTNTTNISNLQTEVNAIVTDLTQFNATYQSLLDGNF